jgi:hypothetical protein
MAPLSDSPGHRIRDAAEAAHNGAMIAVAG